ncbi:MAG: glycine cleavage system protein GcvH [Thermofilaceae archaeon]|nr:glycine cleavage system protein GcvH [Thermofilaceae archaeon]MCX8180798.1 glycine cleavage system protein GcvH [Thermofilaceae archaeon]MDW8004806.1 glycine cleavage system protein GcvH [Thermofilaceae archaeon]
MSESLQHEGYHFPRELKYSEKHSWVKRLTDNRVRVGITDFAQKKLKAVVYIEPPQVGTQVKAGDLLATLESVKAVGEVYAPLEGRVVAYNELLDDDPGLVNRDPYGAGWIVELEVNNPADLDKLLSAEEYVKRVIERGG